MNKMNTRQGDLVRESYEKSLFPSYFSTWLTGKSLSTQKPSISNHWYYYVGFVLSIFLISLWLGFYNLSNYQNISIMLLSWAGLVFSSRRMAAVILHQSVHGRLSKNKAVDAVFGDLVTILMITQDFKTYQHDHCNVHHAPRTFATVNDPIVMFFTKLGIQPGLTKNKLYINFFTTIFSPLFHIKFFITRLRYNININRPTRSIFSIAYISLLVYLSYYISGNLLSLFIAFIIPVAIFYQVSAFVEMCSEHAWFDSTPKSIAEREQDLYFYADISWGRFCGSQYPNNKGYKILAWYFSQLCFHLPVRLFILVGDLPQHDYHHRKPLCLNWINATYNRQNSASNPEKDEPKYTEIWGLQNAINHVFNIMTTKSKNELSRVQNI
ncbi:hypothetical protein BHECKSOX_2489 [Bathymodiolus heckerae thiotrophic gill symbiont]|uniref:fatty acid desaturase n=1 Tax=Bathymodiolus heckerae thiotrophic gill symbiont TaxID=1052212 RepID=UPI0010B078A0|nr:fatty acid desaturase [Bathymodiolus heckerae thiotrophic gill symbiont]SHN89884.1 hypothetical protein BHECKSOX_2489 [Bathymodiolus heckerae thiotrophic gill symbiont]